jgi:flagellar hook-length control protein FliK
MRLKAAKEGAGKQGSGQSSELPGESASSEAAKGELALSRDQGNPSALAGRAVPGTQGDYDIAAAKDVQAPQHSLSESLAARLRDGAADIVRSAQVFLKEGDSGVIRLRLEPESLGGVKIELKMTEKQISGKIVVESDIAGEAFRSSLDALKDAFAESGFETTALEVEVRNGMASGSGGERGGAGEDDGGPYWSRSLRELEAAVPPAAQTARDGVLNVIV